MGNKKGGAAKAASKAEAKAAKKAKLAGKAERKANKDVEGNTGGASSKKGKGKGKAAEDDDLEDLIQTLAEYRKRWEEEHKTTEESTEIPSRRANATLVACPVSTSLWLMGGEYFDGTSCYFYPDLYRYNTEKNEWRRLSSPTQPGPRSAAQLVASPASGGRLWLFGGEFAALNQSSFHHYRDLWAFNISDRTWERFDTKLKPSARSGHRMALWKHLIVLFGGFHDVGIRTTYLSDLWIWDTVEYRWHEVVMRDVDRKPSARSGFSFLPCPEGIILHGGYCKEYQGKQVKGVPLDDTWFLKMDVEPTKIKWERRKKVGYAPTIRSGVQMALWQAKGIGVMFGGVHDSYDDDEDLTSSFYNDLFGYQTAGNGRWISMALKRPKKKPTRKAVRKQVKAVEDDHQGAAADNSEHEESGEDDAMDGDIGDAVHKLTNGISKTALPEGQTAPTQDEDDPDHPDKTIPIARYNAMMAVQRNTLYIYGGIVEAQNREFTLDDFYSLQLDKLDRFTCLKECNIAELEWKESDSESDGSDSSGSDDESDDEAERPEADDQQAAPVEAAPAVEEDVQEVSVAAAAEDTAAIDLRKRATAFMGVAKDAKMSAEELLSTPLPGETLTTFYNRTRERLA